MHAWMLPCKLNSLVLNDSSPSRPPLTVNPGITTRTPPPSAM